MSSLTPVRDDRSATAETFRSLDHALGFYGFPQKRRRDPTRSLFYVALLRRGSCPGRTRNQPAKEFAAQSTLSTPPHGIAAEPPDRGTLRLQTPSAFSRPWQRATLGLPCPVSLPTVSQRRRISPPAPSTTGHLTTETYMSKRRVHPRRVGLSPVSTAADAAEPRE